MTASSILTSFALTAAQLVGSASGTTAYSYRMQTAGGTTGPIVSLAGDSPYAFTDCSGWVNYALDSVSPLHQAVLSAARLQAQFNPGGVEAYNPADPATPHRLSIHEATQPLARAFVISHVFAEQADGSNGFTAVPLGIQVRPGDIFAYASGIYTNPSDPQAGSTPGLSDVSDTGHTGIVVGMPVEVPRALWGGTGLEAEVAAVWAVPVVDSSSVPHFQDIVAAGGAPGFTQPVEDSRRTGPGGTYRLPADLGSLPDGLTASALSHGGLGTGTIWFAMDASGKVLQLRFAEADPWLPNHVSTTPAAEAVLSLSIGRLSDHIALEGSMLDASGRLLVTLWPQADHAAAVTSPALSGAGGLHLLGDGGILTLSTGSSFTGGVLLGQGTTLALAGRDAAGKGDITFAAGEDATLAIARGALEHGLLGNVIRGWDAGDTVDLEGMAYGADARAMLSHGVLHVTSGGESAVLRVAGIAPGRPVTLADDGHGGMLLRLAADAGQGGTPAPGGGTGGTGVAAAHYLAANPDVAAAHVDPVLHYHAVGWREGRDPGPLFSTRFYLESNPDVAAAGIDPLQHYEQIGWREGRSPSPVFDTRAYLAANPDVAAAGIDPLEHYAWIGWREGRDPGPLFSTRDYLAANPDVAAAGVNPLEHFLVFGWREGRDPNALFDTSDYLAHNPDVAVAGVDPFLHYLMLGWQEGRSPSAAFDGPAYAAAHPEAAGRNPLADYLSQGVAEGAPIPVTDWN